MLESEVPESQLRDKHLFQKSFFCIRLRIALHSLCPLLALFFIANCGIKWRTFIINEPFFWCAFFITFLWHIFFTSTVALCQCAFSSHLLWHCIGAHFHLYICCGIGLLPALVCSSIFEFVGVLASKWHQHICRNCHCVILRL